VSDLRSDLELIGEGLDYPRTPDVAPAVAAKLRTAGRRRRGTPAARVLRVAVIAALVMLLLAASALAASRAVREFFGLQGATVERRGGSLPELPVSRGGPDLGASVSLEAARRAASFDVLVPARAGEPDEVRLRRSTPGGEVSLLYAARNGLPRSGPTGVGLLVSEFRGAVNPDYLGKVVAQTTRVEPLTVDGNRAIWIEGAPHLFFYRTPDGRFAERPLRLAANVLLLQRGSLLVRLEGDFGRAQAVRLAASLR
jgi:hypothetical protein